ncbi:glycosyltransferase family 10 domain-containing protein [Sphingomonas radiodurans]|uniref:glycosyltransferase family 10 domain-containing protein n=1 Tax=Sphingomonas radiodurans TaxID=2890321 RepID=UPI001E35CB4B|nr:glycosyltransferase family 10 [Sphingomonas radiodurans]WBH15099.1 glycosyltransferase family 10 [Sphingomonas radiodurans]
MSDARPHVNILHSYGHALFGSHFDPVRDGFDVVENDTRDRLWDLVIVFEAITAPQRLRVRGGRVVFISGEPPEIGNHGKAFLRQVDAVFCAGACPRLGPGQQVSGEQHFNNWHFGYSRDTGYRHGHEFIRDLLPPAKTQMLSTVTSNLNYLPMHIKRRALVDRLARDYAGRLDIFGRPHRYVEYKEDAILPYRFHLCVENCAVPDLWTEKIADALLGYAVPVYAGCPNIDRYFPGATIAIDLDDYASTRRTIDAILSDGEAIYRERLAAVIEARKQLIERYDISALVGTMLQAPAGTMVRDIVLRPEASFSMAGLRDLAARTRRKAMTLLWRRRIARHG